MSDISIPELLYEEGSFGIFVLVTVVIFIIMRDNQVSSPLEKTLFELTELVIRLVCLGTAGISRFAGIDREALKAEQPLHLREVRG